MTADRQDWTYSNTFYDYIEKGALPSAKALVGLVSHWLNPQSVLDVGCGRGIWLKTWKESGASEIFGVDGSYVDALRLHIEKAEFQAVDLAGGFSLGRKFDLVQSLEVAEHLPPASSTRFIESLSAHGDVILFSAAVPGQGGENHQNERDLSFWRAEFERLGYSAFDAVRPRLLSRVEVEPWYRFNTILYANAPGAERLPADIRATLVPTGKSFTEYGDIGWRLRRAAVSLLPRSAVDYVARVRAQRIARQLAGLG